MKHQKDVIIVGGGVIGLTTAYFLAREGVQVVVCEQGKVGMESSWAGAGILPPSDMVHARKPFDRLRAISGRLFPELSRELRERTGIDNGFTCCGALEFQCESAADEHEWYGTGIVPETLERADWSRLEPNLAANLGKALHIPAMAQLRNPRHMQALRSACLKTNKVAIIEDAQVHGFDVEGNRVKGVRTSNEVLSGDTYVVAAGAWTDRLLEPLGCHLRIVPVRGQIALLNPGTTLLRRILVRGAQYLVPRSDGRVLIGSTEEHTGFAKDTTAAGIHGLLALGLQMVPRLAEAPLERTWAGLRPGSPDGLPFIGPTPDLSNLYVAAGHFRAGIQLSPGTAVLLKECILGEAPSMPMDAFRLDRN
jgi:glycine oxidase